jgi:hypothetical protein
VLVHLRCGSKCALPFLSENIECVSIRNIVRGGGNKCAALILCIEEVPAGCSGLEVLEQDREEDARAKTKTTHSKKECTGTRGQCMCGAFRDGQRED